MTNCLVSMLYNNPVSKQFVWDLCGNYMLNKLSKDNENKINIPVESEYGIEWQGVKYSIIKEELDWYYDEFVNKYWNKEEGVCEDDEFSI